MTRAEASRINGAKSKGPITPQGKANSSSNNTRHGLLARSVVLEEENEQRFFDFYQRMLDEFQPATDSELAELETMASARWRRMRSWALQKVLMDRNVAHQDPHIGPAPVRAAVGFDDPDQPGTSHPVLHRYEVSLNRLYAGALSRLRMLQESNRKRNLRPFSPESFAYVWKEDTDIAVRTQEAIENEASARETTRENQATRENPRSLDGDR